MTGAFSLSMIQHWYDGAMLMWQEKKTIFIRKSSLTSWCCAHKYISVIRRVCVASEPYITIYLSYIHKKAGTQHTSLFLILFISIKSAEKKPPKEIPCIAWIKPAVVTTLFSKTNYHIHTYTPIQIHRWISFPIVCGGIDYSNRNAGNEIVCQQISTFRITR